MVNTHFKVGDIVTGKVGTRYSITTHRATMKIVGILNPVDLRSYDIKVGCTSVDKATVLAIAKKLESKE